MDKLRALIKSEWFIAVVLLAALSALAYLPFIAHFGYFNDDWYEMYAAGARGPAVFIDIFSIDRPARAFLMIPLYVLFGANPLPYNITAYLFRLFGGLSVLWSLRMAWPGQKRLAWIAALFYLIYPGFLSQPNAIDFQSHIAGLFFATFSIALSLKAVTTQTLGWRIFLSGLSIFFGLAYLGQMEYYAGYEVVRLVLLFLLAAQTEKTFLRRLKRAALWYLPFLIVPVLFFTWRIFFFQDIRKQTDLGTQLGSLILSPKHTILVWSATLIQNMLDVIVLAWIVPFYNVFSALSPVDMFASLGIGLVAILIGGFTLRSMDSNSTREMSWHAQNLWAGLVIVAGGLLPVIVANRSVDFADFSRYAVISMFGAAIIVTVLIDKLKQPGFQTGMILLLIGTAVITHFSNGEAYARSTESYNAFWWQVSWRIPQMETGTTLIVNAPVGHLGEDYTVWSPANLIYYPQSQNPQELQPGIYAALLRRETAIKVMMHLGQEYDTRRVAIHTYTNYHKILILSQPTPFSCVQVMNGNQTEFSSSEDERVMLLAPYSQTKNITPGPQFKTPPEFPFGLEPGHGWCYYYEKASYARQTGDWQAVVNLGDQTAALGLAPRDPIEWLPFLQAYARFGNQTRLTQLAHSINSDAFVTSQACRILTAMPLDPSTAGLVKSLYCASN